MVGDDDQSIYRWRGARVENLQQFRRDYPQAQLFRLEQNYRSTAIILEAANGAHRPQRGAPRQEPVDQRRARRADPAVRRLQRARRGGVRRRTASASGWQRGGARREIAILYRSNAQSRVFEEAFLSARMPYRVYGGLRFFERAEIKDALAYLRLIANRHDDASFERVVNLPTRGIGAKSLDLLREYARRSGGSLWEAAAAVERRRCARRQGERRPARLPAADRAARRRGAQSGAA